MSKRRGRALIACVSFLLLAAGAHTASARRLSISQNNFRIVFNPLTIRVTNGELSVPVQCDVTLEGTLHSREITKTADTLIGQVTRAIVNHNVGSCANGEIWALNGTELLAGVRVGNTLPWHVQYVSFDGTLPNIAHVTVRYIGLAFLAQFRFMGFTLRCLYVANNTVVDPARSSFILSSGRITGAFMEGRMRTLGGAECPITAIPEGTGTVTVLEGTTPLTITLI